MVEHLSIYFGDEVLMGAGTVLDPETARVAILAGAEFIVTPTLNRNTIELCHRYGKPIICGAFSPTEILTSWEAGSDFVKVFPASLGGPAYIKSVLAPLPQVRIVPVGGVSSSNAADYIKAGATGLGVGGKLVDKTAVAQGDWGAITEEARQLVNAVKVD